MSGRFAQQLLRGRAAAKGPNAGTAAPVKPSTPAAAFSLLLLVAAVLAAALVPEASKTPFEPRVPTVDALAGLALGAFFVDRLLTFVPPWFAVAKPAKRRTVDVAYLRIGFGAALGAVFVLVTDLGAVKALITDKPPISEGVDRAIATLAIAGGVAGLARLLSGLNPQPDSEDPDAAAAGDAQGGQAADDDADQTAEQRAAAAKAAEEKVAAERIAAGGDVLPTPTRQAYLFGLICLGIAALIGLLAMNDDSPLELLGSDPDQPAAATDASAAASEAADLSTPAVVVRFGIVILLAGIVEQFIERVVSPFVRAKENKALVTGGLAAVLGVLAAVVVHLFLLHNVGFFGANGTTTLKDAVAQSSNLERWFDTFATGLIIAAGTKPLHDLSSRLRKRSAAPKDVVPT